MVVATQKEQKKKCSCVSFFLSDLQGSVTGCKSANLRKKNLFCITAENVQLYGCECGGREEATVGSGVVLQSGTLAVWNAGRGQSRWELSAAVLETVSKLSVTLLPPPSASLTSLLSLVSRHKSVGPSCVTKMKQAQTTLFEPSMLLLPLPAGGDGY